MELEWCVCVWGDNRYFFPLATILGSVRIPLSGNSRKVGELARMGWGRFQGVVLEKERQGPTTQELAMAPVPRA